MKKHPILFSGPMVRALLARTKTQTRRLRKPSWVPGDRLWVRETHAISSVAFPKHDGASERGVMYKADFQRDRTPRDHGGWAWPGKWKPSIFMPRWASRTTLEVVRTWQEPLQDISHDDAIAEGVQEYNVGGRLLYGVEGLPDETFSSCPIEAYANLWDSINGKTKPWESNPLVYATEFRVVANG